MPTLFSHCVRHDGGSAPNPSGAAMHDAEEESEGCSQAVLVNPSSQHSALEYPSLQTDTRFARGWPPGRDRDANPRLRKQNETERGSPA
jgi:hypothetical protein